MQMGDEMKYLFESVATHKTSIPYLKQTDTISLFYLEPLSSLEG